MTRPRRVAWLVVAFLAVGCATQAAAPRESAPPAATASASPSPSRPNQSTDLLYVRGYGSPADQGARITVVDARTGAKLRQLPSGPVTSDRALVIGVERTSSGPKTTVALAELATGKLRRAADVEGYYYAAESDQGWAAASDRFVALAEQPVKLNESWISRFAVVDLESAAAPVRAELADANNYGFVALSPDGRWLYLTQNAVQNGGTVRLRVWDVARRSFLPENALGPWWDGVQRGFESTARSADGRWLFRLDVGSQTTNCRSTDGPECTPNGSPPHIVALDLAAHQASVMELGSEQTSTDYEKYLLWSLALSKDGTRLYAVNPALGIAEDIDVGPAVQQKQMHLRGTYRIPASRAEDGVLAALGRAIFPVAEAKRYVRGGALLSPDGRTLYAIGAKGIAVIDASTLASRGTWIPDMEPGNLALSPDGARLYAIDDRSGKIVILSTSDGSSLGSIGDMGNMLAIVRVDLAP